MAPGRPQQAGVKQPAALLTPAPAGMIRNFILIFEDPQQISLDGWPGQIPNRTELVARLPLRRPERLCIVSNVEPFEMSPVPLPDEVEASLRSQSESPHGVIGFAAGKADDGAYWIVEGPLRIDDAGVAISTDGAG